MAKKEIHHEKFEECYLTKEDIDTDKDDYTIVVDCRGNRVLKTKFYKSAEFSKFIHGEHHKKNKKKMNNVMDNLRGIRDSLNNSMGKLSEGGAFNQTSGEDENKKEVYVTS